MNNFINVRIQSVSQVKVKNNFGHNVRTKQSRNDSNNKTNYFYKLDNNSYLRSELESEGNGEAYKYLQDMYNDDRAKHNELYYERTKYKMPNENGSWLEGVITFSEAIKHDLGYKYSTQQLEYRAIKIVNEIATYFNVEPRGVVLHMSETTPHFHFYLQNFDDIGRSVTHMFKSKKHFSHLQDVAFKHLSDLGMQRGISKEVSFHRHQDTKAYHEREITKLNHQLHNAKEKYSSLKGELEGVKQDLQTTIQKLQEVQHEYKLGYDTLNQQKNTLKEVRKALDKTSNEFQQVDSLVKDLMQQEKSLRAKHKTIKDDISKRQNDLKIVETKQQELEHKFDRTNEYLDNDIQQIKSNVIELVKKSKDEGIFSDTINETKIKRLIYQELKKVHTIFETNRELVAKNQKMEKKFNTMYERYENYVQVVNRNATLEDEFESQNKELQNLRDTNSELRSENEKLIEELRKINGFSDDNEHKREYR